MTSLRNRLSAGELLILDGAIGTELERRGVPSTGDAAWAQALATDPDLVYAVHADYLRAGANVITTNTYSSGAHVLEKIGRLDEFERWNKLAVDLARQAHTDHTGEADVYVAGSISGFGNGAMRYSALDGSITWGEDNAVVVSANFRRQSEVLARAGVDLLLLELLCVPSVELQVAIEAVAECELPLWISLGIAADADTGELVLNTMERELGFVAPARQIPLQEVMWEACDWPCDALLVMRSQLDSVAPAFEVMRDNWRGPLGAYPNRTGRWDGNQWVFSGATTPAVYAELAEQWAVAGAQIIGGCCGVGPEHIAAVRDRFRK